MIRKLVYLCLLLTGPLWIQGVQASPFDKGVVSGSIIIGSGRAYYDNYTILGIGIGYYLENGLQIGLDYEYWSGGEPTIQQISPRLTYVFAREKSLSPYVGVFYRNTKVDTLPDTDAYGARAGVYMRSGNKAIMGLGVAYIEYNDCVETIFQSCSDTYPELMFGVYF